MANERAPRPPESETQSQSKRQPIPVELAPARDLPVVYANKVLVNFTGNEFLVTVYAAFPEPWAGPAASPPKKLEAKPLARYAFSIPEWYGAVKSFNVQFERLQSKGALVVQEARSEGTVEVEKA